MIDEVRSLVWTEFLVEVSDLDVASFELGLNLFVMFLYFFEMLYDFRYHDLEFLV